MITPGYRAENEVILYRGKSWQKSTIKGCGCNPFRLKQRLGGEGSAGPISRQRTAGFKLKPLTLSHSHALGGCAELLADLSRRTPIRCAAIASHLVGVSLAKN